MGFQAYEMRKRHRKLEKNHSNPKILLIYPKTVRVFTALAFVANHLVSKNFFLCTLILSMYNQVGPDKQMLL